jgi:hypothetical protein
MVRQVLGAIAQFEKATLVAKLRGARERKKAKTGKAEGRKSYAEANPKLVELAHQLNEQRPRLSLREISAALAAGPGGLGIADDAGLMEVLAESGH